MELFMFVAVSMLLGAGAAAAATVPWSALPPRVAPNVWARTASASLRAASVSTSSASDQAPETILYDFKGIPDGNFPAGGLIDYKGALYGTTDQGGLALPSTSKYGGGTVFKVTRTEHGFAESVLYRFGSSGPNDGYFPEADAAGPNALAVDHTGALYGTTLFGGFKNNGIVYKLSPTAHGYTEKILYKFQGANDGCNPASNPILSRSGALYGVAQGCGRLDDGVVYKLTPTASGYAFSVLDDFGTYGANDGYNPSGPLLLDERTGDLYGTTVYGGETTAQVGTVFKLHPTPSGYVETILHSFSGPDGSYPAVGLIMDRAGALYSTTVEGGIAKSAPCFFYAACGLVFKLTPSTGGYKESVLHYFTGADGGCPSSPLVADGAGVLYSTASCGGLYNNGTVFKLVPTKTGYQEVTLHEFNYETDGYLGDFSEGVLLDGDHLFGEINGGTGNSEYGGVYALKIPCDKH
jgi:uncharacterized repeat protein (TIGR03803 family)